MTDHPIDTIIIDGIDVEKADVRGHEKQYLRLRMADPDEVRNAGLSGQYGGLYVRSLQAFFDLDTGSLDVDDGSSVIVDADGNRFKRVTISSAPTQEKHIAAGDVTLDDDSADIVVIAKTVAAATNVYLPDASTRTRSVRIVDGKYDAATNNITILPKAASGQTIMGGASWIIDSNGASIEFTPLADGSGWV